MYSNSVLSIYCHINIPTTSIIMLKNGIIALMMAVAEEEEDALIIEVSTITPHEMRPPAVPFVRDAIVPAIPRSSLFL